MTKKEGFKTVETDLEELEEKIHDHRKKIFKRIVITIIAVLAVFAAAQLWMALRSYDSYDIRILWIRGIKVQYNLEHFAVMLSSTVMTEPCICMGMVNLYGTRLLKWHLRI